MQNPKRVLVLMNLATVGRSSMAAVLPVLAACGVQGCPLPTALLSSHLGGFGPVATQQTPAAYCESALEKWLEQDIGFDAIYTGYLTDAAQFSLAQKALDGWPNALKVVDPALGDGGRLYSKTTPDMVAHMRALAERADLITPNLTESALLLGEDAEGNTTPAQAEDRLTRLAAKRSVVITSAPLAAAGGNRAGRRDTAAQQPATGILGREKGSTQAFTRPSLLAPGGYPGTGDLFAAALTGRLLQGDALAAAAARAAAFVEAAVQDTWQNGGEARHGVWFEPRLCMLAGPAGH